MGARTASRSAPRTAVSGGLVTGFVLVLLALQASPAAAVEDPTRPDGTPHVVPMGVVIDTETDTDDH